MKVLILTPNEDNPASNLKIDEMSVEERGKFLKKIPEISDVKKIVSEAVSFVNEN